MKFYGSLLFAPAVLATTAWYAEYGADEADRTKQGCFRGKYANGLSLSTCKSEGAVALGELEDTAFLCVVELKHPTMMGRVKDVLSTMAEVAVPLFADEHQVVVGHASSSLDLSPACDIRLFEEFATKVVYVPVEPIVAQQPMPVNHRAVKRSMLGNVSAPDPIISKLVNSYQQDDVTDYLKWTSTDYQGGNTKITRNSYSTRTGTGGCADATWRCAFNFVDELEAEVNQLMKNYPNDWEVERVQFRTDMCSNLVVKILGEKEPDQVVIIGAHMDSRNTGSGPTATGAAPGADDNGSGTAAQLAILKSMAANPHNFYYSVHIMWFCGEEQGLLGSAAIARDYKTRGVNVIGMFNNDMIGYTYQGTVTLSFMVGSATAWLSQSCKEFSTVYVPSLKVGDTTGCCSDQQSFYAQGFPAAGIFETPTSSVVYPQYHRAGDTFDNGLINMKQVYQFGQANYACILEYAIPYDDNTIFDA